MNGDVGQPGPVEPLSTRPAVASPPDSTVTSSYSSATSGTSAPSVIRPGPRAKVTCRRLGGGAACTRIQAPADGATLNGSYPGRL